MKRIALFLMIVMFAASAFAAVKKVAPASAASVAVNPSGVLTVGKVGIGMGTDSGNIGTMFAPSLFVSYNFTDSLQGKLGLKYSQDNAAGAAATSQTGFSGALDYMLPMKVGGVQTFVGGQYSTDGAPAATSIISLSVGIRTEIGNNVTLATGLVPYSSSSAAGVSSTTITTGAGHVNLRGPFINFSVDIN